MLILDRIDSESGGSDRASDYAFIDRGYVDAVVFLWAPSIRNRHWFGGK